MIQMINDEIKQKFIFIYFILIFVLTIVECCLSFINL